MLNWNWDPKVFAWYFVLDVTHFGNQKMENLKVIYDFNSEKNWLLNRNTSVERFENVLSELRKQNC